MSTIHTFPRRSTLLCPHKIINRNLKRTVIRKTATEARKATSHCNCLKKNIECGHRVWRLTHIGQVDAAPAAVSTIVCAWWTCVLSRDVGHKLTDDNQRQTAADDDRTREATRSCSENHLHLSVANDTHDDDSVTFTVEAQETPVVQLKPSVTSEKRKSVKDMQLSYSCEESKSCCTMLLMHGVCMYSQCHARRVFTPPPAAYARLASIAPSLTYSSHCNYSMSVYLTVTTKKTSRYSYLHRHNE